jgi:hypothetical protein
MAAKSISKFLDHTRGHVDSYPNQMVNSWPQKQKPMEAHSFYGKIKIRGLCSTKTLH